MYWSSVRSHSQVLLRNCGGCWGAQLLLCLLSCFLQAASCNLIFRNIYTVLVLNFGYDPVDNSLIPIVTTELVITIGCLNLNGYKAILIILTNFKQGHIEGTTTQIEDENTFVFLALFEAVSQSCCGWLVNNTKHVQASDGTSILSCLTLSIVEVCRAGNNCIGYWLAEVCLGIALELHKNLSGNLLWSPFLIVNLHGPVSTHMTLHRRNRAVYVGYCLTLCYLTNNNFAGLAKSNNRWSGAGAFCVYDNGWLTTFQCCNAGVCCT